MIQGVFGLPGSGKSTYLAKQARKAQKKGVKVYSNFYIKGCYQLDFDDLGIHEYSDCLLLIDEISLFCDCRNWKNFDKNLVYFFTNHRHYNVDIIYCSQSYADCDKKIRNLTDSLYYIRSGFLGFSTVRLINKVFNVDTDITEGYSLAGWPELVLRRRYYKMFDSFVRRPLPDNTSAPWDSTSFINAPAAARGGAHRRTRG